MSIYDIKGRKRVDISSSYVVGQAILEKENLRIKNWMKDSDLRLRMLQHEKQCNYFQYEKEDHTETAYYNKMTNNWGN